MSAAVQEKISGIEPDREKEAFSSASRRHPDATEERHVTVRLSTGDTISQYHTGTMNRAIIC